MYDVEGRILRESLLETNDAGVYVHAILQDLQDVE